MGLQPERGGADVVGPVTIADHRQGFGTVDAGHPVGPVEIRDVLGNGECLAVKDLALGVGKRNVVILAGGGNHDDLIANGDDVRVAPSVIHMPAHEIDAARGAHHKREALLPMSLDECIQCL